MYLALVRVLLRMFVKADVERNQLPLRVKTVLAIVAQFAVVSPLGHD